MRDIDDFEGRSTQSSTPRTSTERARSTSQASSSQASSRCTSSTQRSASSQPLPKHETRGVLESIKELMESQRTADDGHAAKQLKMERDVEMEKIKLAERIAQIQADTQIKQMEVVSQMMQQVIKGMNIASTTQTSPSSKPESSS